MHALHEFELQIIEFFHQVRSVQIDSLFKYLDFFDRQEFMLILIPAIWIGYSWRWGTRLFYLVLISAFVNYFLKESFQQPRPFHLDPSLGVMEVSGYGFPSGAAQSTLLLSGLLLKLRKNKWMWLLVLNLIFWICFSRIYLGVHFPSDIVGGWIVGGVLFLMYGHATPKIERFLAQQPRWALLCLSQLIPLFLLSSYYSIPTIRLAGAAMGAGIGLFIATRHKICLHRPKKKREASYRAVLGILGTFLIYKVAPQLNLKAEDLNLIIQFFLIGLWVSLGGHLACRKLMPDFFDESIKDAKLKTMRGE